MIYISKKIEKKIFYNLIKKGNFSFSFLRFVLRKTNDKFLKQYLYEVGLIKKIK